MGKRQDDPSKKRKRPSEGGPSAGLGASSSKPGAAHGQARKVQIIASNDDSTTPFGPVMATFPSQIPSSSTPFTMYASASSSAPLIISGSTSTLEYTSTHSAPSCSYHLALLPPSSSTLLLSHALPHLPLTTTIKALKNLPPIQSTQSDMSGARSNLGTTFGTKKAQRAIRTKERNKIDPGSMMGVADHLTAAIGAQTASLPTTESIKATADSQRPIPKFNLAAVVPKDVYALADIVSPAELGALQIDSVVSASSALQAQQFLPTRSSSWYINLRLQQIFTLYPGSLPKKAEKQLRVLFYLSYLISLSSIHKWSPPEALEKKLRTKGGDCPDVVRDGFVERFTEGFMEGGKEKRAMGSQGKVKRLSWIAALALWYDEFVVPISDLHADLQIESRQLQEIFKSLGCQITKPTASELEIITALSLGMKTEEGAALGVDTAKERVAKLVVPLKFPEIRRGKARK